MVFNVKNGEVDGTDVSGLTVAVVCDTPKVMSEGNWRLGSELTVSRATRSKVNAFGIQYEAKAGFSTSEFSWAA